MPGLAPCGGVAKSAKMGGMKAPAITLRCDCGADGRAKYGERWTCESCGRVYDTTEIPEGEYRAVASLDLRYRLFGYGVLALMAVFVLVAAVRGDVIQIMATLGVVLLGWFLFLKPLVHRRHKRAVGLLTRRWQLHAEGGDGS
jgi:hypothetical protein